MNVFKELIISVYDFKSYREFLNNKRRKVFFSRIYSYGYILCSDHDRSVRSISG